MHLPYFDSLLCQASGSTGIHVSEHITPGKSGVGGLHVFNPCNEKISQMNPSVVREQVWMISDNNLSILH